MNTSLVTKLDDNLRDDLAQYGIVRAVAAKKAPANKDKANFFGYQDRGAEVELVFSKDDKVLAEAVEDGMQLALIPTENEPFNMLIQKDFKKAIVGKDPETLREFLRRILDEA